MAVHKDIHRVADAGGAHPGGAVGDAVNGAGEQLLVVGVKGQVHCHSQLQVGDVVLAHRKGDIGGLGRQHRQGAVCAYAVPLGAVYRHHQAVHWGGDDPVGEVLGDLIQLLFCAVHLCPGGGNGAGQLADRGVVDGTGVAALGHRFFLIRLRV